MSKFGWNPEEGDGIMSAGGSMSNFYGMVTICFTKNFVNLKSNSAFLYNKGYNLLTSFSPPKHVKLIKFPLKS